MLTTIGISEIKTSFKIPKQKEFVYAFEEVYRINFPKKKLEMVENLEVKDPKNEIEVRVSHIENPTSDM